MKLRRFIGDKAFYRMAFMVAAPMIIQNGITNFVAMLDNIMVGRIGTEQMSGVAIVNNLLFVFNVSIFGAVAGPGIFAAQFFGRGDHKGVRDTMRFKYVAALLFCAVGLGVFLMFGEPLINLYLNDGASEGDVVQTMIYGKQYLGVILVGLIPFALTQVYAGTLRESGETMVPMKAGITAVFVNLVGNYLLIYGKFGCPELGVRGAAIATVISRFVECAIVIFWTHRNTEKNPYAVGLFRGFSIPRRLVLDILRKGSPLMINEGIWAAGMAMVTQSYSLRGLEVVAGLNIANTLLNLVNVVYLTMGNVVGIIIGQLLGAGKMEEARDKDNKLIALAVFSCAVMGSLLAVLAPFFPLIYTTTDQVRDIATKLMWVAALFMPMNAFMHASYFTLRSGGKTVITFIFDSGFLWCVTVPVVFLVSRFTEIPIIPLYFIGLSSELIKCAVGFVLVKRGSWLQNIVENKNQA